VLRLSGERQYTWDSSNIIGDFYFIPKTDLVKQDAQMSQVPQVQAASRAMDNVAKSEKTKSVVDSDMLAKRLSRLTDQSIQFEKRVAEKDAILKYFVVSYAKVNIMINNRIDERISAEKILNRLLTLPLSEVKVQAMENSDSGRIIEVSIEIND
jgi:hypothetical protein